MSQDKRFGKRVAMPSTVQIIRELKILMRHDPEQAGPAAEANPGLAGPLDAAPLPDDLPASRLSRSEAP